MSRPGVSGELASGSRSTGEATLTARAALSRTLLGVTLLGALFAATTLGPALLTSGALAPPARAAQALAPGEVQRLLREAEVAMSSARTLIARNDKRRAVDRLREAEQLYRRILDRNPEEKEAAIGLAQTLLLTKRHDEGVALLTPFRARLPADHDVAHQLGLHLYYSGQHDLAVPLLEEVAPDAGRFDANWLLAVYYYRRADWERGLPFVERYVAERADDTRALALLGTYYLKTERLEQALATLERYLTDHPENMAARINRANALFRLGRLAAAGEEYERMLREDPGRVRVVYNLAAVRIKQGRCEEAVALLDRFLASASREASALYFKGDCLIQLGRWQEARETFELAQGESTNNPWIYHALSRIALSEGDLPQALSHAQQAGAIAPDNWEILSWLGTMLRRNKRPAEALVEHDRALALAPDNATIQVERGRDLWALERWPDAEEAFDAARATDPDVPGGRVGSAATRTARAVQLKRAGDAAGARALLSEALELAPYEAARANLALLALEAGDTAGAAEILAQAPPDTASGDLAAVGAMVAVKTGELERARKAAAQARALGTQLVDLLGLAEAYIDAAEGEWERAALAFQAAAAAPDADPTLSRAASFAWLEVGLDRLGRGDPVGARTALNRATAAQADLVRDDRATLALAMAAAAVISSERPADEARALARLIGGQQYRGAAWAQAREAAQTWVAYGYLRADDPDRALEALERVGDDGEGAAGAIRRHAKDLLARRAFNRQEWPLAARIWSELRDATPTDLVATNNLAAALWLAGQTEQAERLWGEIVAQAGPAEAIFNLGNAADRQGQPRRAWELFTEYVERGATRVDEVRERLRAKERVFGFKPGGGT